MTRYVWALTDGIYCLCSEGGPPGSLVVLLWLEATEWHWTVWQRGEIVTRGSVHGRDETPLATAQRLAIEHACDVGVVSGEDEVTT